MFVLSQVKNDEANELFALRIEKEEIGRLRAHILELTRKDKLEIRSLLEVVKK